MNLSTDHCFRLGGWFNLAEQDACPNFDARPPDCVPELLVIHAISLPAGQFSDTEFRPEPGIEPRSKRYIDDLFQNRLDLSAHPDFEQLRGVRVSAHFLIRRCGSLIQFVGTDQRAWHAGTSQYMGRGRCNDFSIGVELEGSEFVPFQATQYDALVRLTGALLEHYPIKAIVGHQDIAPERKTDPGPYFDWLYYQNLLHQRFPLVSPTTTMPFQPNCKKSPL
ncbi:MAG: ampD [Solimicrobium sp.]|jgi:AmpD protein|nr:ampD [Solimicrobium sp.]